MNVVVGAGGAVAVIAVALAFLAWRLVSSTKVRGVDPEWLKKFSVDSYRPMERLLSEEDIRFLRTQPGYDPKIEKVLRRQRRKVFRAYLRSLGQDFGRLHLALRLLVLHAPTDQPELAAMLVRQRAVFLVGLGMAHARLTMYTLGIGTVDVRNLVASLESMRFELHGMVASQSAAA